MAEAAAPERQLKRSLTAFDLTCLGIGAIIGSGIFALTGTAAAGADYAAVSVAIKRFEGRMRADRKLAQVVEQARARLVEESNVEC